MFEDFIDEWGINDGIRYHICGFRGSRILCLQTPDDEFACVWWGKVPPDQSDIDYLRDRERLHSKIEMYSYYQDIKENANVDIVMEIMKLKELKEKD